MNGAQHRQTNDEVPDLCPTRQSLLGRLKDWNDQQSWREFFDTYWRLIYNVAVKSGLTEAEAQDVVQETVLRVAKKMKRGFQYDPAQGSFKGWLLQLTGWQIANQFKKRPKASSTPPLPADATRTATEERVPDAKAGLALERLWEAEWHDHLLAAAMERVRRKVKPLQFQAFQMSAMQQKSVSQIARFLGINAAQVYWAKHAVARLLQKEVRHLQNHGSFIWIT
jgi:RNA polymerase sigma-70 factor (ECF subfamily)